MNCKHKKTHWTEKDYLYWHSNDSFSTIERCSNCGIEWNTTYTVNDRDEIEGESK
tara:strand:+ start:1596 stop:1760 length:165 start_codon:yes stop_codon:yes gene_type:complete